MNFKSVLIPVAAFAVTVTGVSAFNSDVLEKAGLNEAQISAFAEAKELRQQGDNEAARDVLEEAGIDMDAMERIRKAMSEGKSEHHLAMKTAIENDDYAAFRAAVDGSPLYDIIDTEAEFKSFVEAQRLMKEGEKEEAGEILAALGLEGKLFFGGERKFKLFDDQLSEEQRVELKAAFEAKDHDRAREIMAEAGIELPEDKGDWGHGMLKLKVGN